MQCKGHWVAPGIVVVSCFQTCRDKISPLSYHHWKNHISFPLWRTSWEETQLVAMTTFITCSIEPVKPATTQSKISEADQLPAQSFWLIFTFFFLMNEDFKLVESSCGNTSLGLQGANMPMRSSKRSCNWGKHSTQNIPSPIYLTTAFAEAQWDTCGLKSIFFSPFMLTWSVRFLGREIWTRAPRHL